MTEPLTPATPFVMVGDPDAAVCTDDTCLLPGVELAAAADRELEDGEAAQVEPGPVG
jgi:hypothetical protein